MLTVASVYMIIVLNKVIGKLNSIDKQITSIENKVIPLLDNLNKVIIDTGVITGEIKVQMDDISILISSYRRKGEDILAYIDKAEMVIAQPIRYISAVSSGIKTFINVLKNKYSETVSGDDGLYSQTG